MFRRQVRCDRLLIPANVDVAELTRVLHVLVDGDTQPRVLTCLWGRVSHKLVVVLVQTKVMATDMALKVKMGLFVTLRSFSVALAINKFLCKGSLQ